MTHHLRKGASFLLVMLVSFANLAQSQSEQETLITELTSFGFENVQALTSQDTLFITYENRIFRFEVKALEKIILLIGAEIPASTNTILIFPKYHGIPMLQVLLNKAQLEALTKDPTNALAREISYSLSLPYLPGGFKKTETAANKSFRKLDWSLGPWINDSQIGIYEAPFQIEFDLSSTFHIQLTKGLKFTGQVLFPIFNNYIFLRDGIRPNILTLEQSFRLPFNTFSTLTVGQFGSSRIGGLVEVMKYSKTGRFGIGIDYAYTDFSSLGGRAFIDFYEKKPTLLAQIKGIYRIPAYDLSFRVNYGTFLYQDLGIRIECFRQFGESQIGIHLTKTTLNENAGFRLLMPLPTKKYASINRFRIRPQRYLGYVYNFRGQAFSAQQLPSYYSLSDKVLEFQPSLMRNHLFDNEH
jgi:hypothetical protein